MPLTAVQVRNAKAGRHADEKGLYLLVKPSGAKSGVLRIQADGRRRDFGLGSVDLTRRDEGLLAGVLIGQRKSLTLAEARMKAAEGRALTQAGKDPSFEWKRQGETIPTFAEAAKRYHDKIKAGFRNKRHSDSWLSSLEAYAFPSSASAPRVLSFGSAVFPFAAAEPTTNIARTKAQESR